MNLDDLKTTDQYRPVQFTKLIVKDRKMIRKKMINRNQKTSRVPDDLQ